MELKVTFETITPLWTGDAWGKNSKIRPASIMGSLRFWFEVISYFTGVTTEENYEEGKLKCEFKAEEFEAQLLKYGSDFNGINKALKELKVPLPARIFGCTGWKGWVRVKAVDFDESKFKNDRNGRIIQGKNWFWGTPYYEGKFDLTWEVNDEIVEGVFYPLLSFIERYGFLGGKWNIGYGRVKVRNLRVKENGRVEDVNDWRRNKFVFNIFWDGLSDLDFSLLCKSTTKWSELEDRSSRKIYFLENGIFSNSFKELVQKLLEIKALHRRDISNRKKRHEIFGEGGKNAKGNKVLPWILEENGRYRGGFISIAGVINLK